MPGGSLQLQVIFDFAGAFLAITEECEKLKPDG
jgi:hypothetical protein